MTPEDREPTSRLLRFIAELRRRRVYRVAAAYAAGAFVLWQAAAVVVPALELPDWVLTAVVVGAIVGFPVVLVLAWAFNVTPEGLRRVAPGTEGRPHERPVQGEREPGEARRPPEPGPAREAGDESAAAVGEREATVRPRTPRPVRLASAAVTLLAAAGLGWWFWPTETLAFSEGDAVLLADFDNRTGDTLFDRSLQTAFRIGLEQSPYANVVSRADVDDALRRMRRDPDTTRVTASVAREIAQRDGIPAVVVPHIADVGGRYVLAYEVHDPATGETVASERVRVEEREDVLDGLDRLSGRLREFLGESPELISRHSRPLAEVTTESLEALRAFSLAVEHVNDAQWEEARADLRSALALDSAFTGARAQLGIIEYQQFDREAGRKMLRAALENAGDLTRYEAMAIRGFYADAVEGDLEKAADIYRSLTDLYPNRLAPHNNLGWVLSRSGSPEAAAAAYRRALAIDSSHNLVYSGLASVYLYSLGRVDSALALARRRVEIDSTFAQAWDHLGWAYLAVDSLEAARRAFERAVKLRPASTTNLFRLGHVHRLAGRYREAEEAFRRIVEVDSTAYGAHYQLGVVLRKAGDEEAAQEHFRTYRRTVEQIVEENGRAYDRLDLARVLTRLGQRDEAWEIAREALATDSASGDLRFGMALVASVQERRDAAVRHLEAAFDLGYTNYVWPKVHPDFEPVYDDPRFEALLRERLWLPGAGTATGAGESA